MSVLYDDGVFHVGTRAVLGPGLAVTYATNDTSLSLAERQYLQRLQDFGADQDLSQDLRSYVRAISIAFTVFAAVVVGLRFKSRRLHAAKILIDDYLMLASLVLLIGNMTLNIILVDHGIGLHSGVLPLENIQFLNRTMLGAEILYCSAVSLYKIALLFLYFRIFPLPEVRKYGRICGFIVAGWTGAVYVAASAQCIPIVKLWEPWRDGWCINLFLTQLAIAVPCILLDLAILCLPIPHVLRLQMNRTQKIFVMVVFLLGSYVVFTSVYRFRVFLLFTQDDAAYTLADGLSWNIIEISSGIISACLPTLAPVLRWLFKNIMSSTALNSAKQGSSSGGGTTNLKFGGGGTGLRSGHRHKGSASKQWIKINTGASKPDVSASRGEGVSASSRSREDHKYGISLTTIMRDDDSRSSDDLELIAHQAGLATPTPAAHQGAQPVHSSPSQYPAPAHTKPNRSSSRHSQIHFTGSVSPGLRSPLHHTQQPGGGGAAEMGANGQQHIARMAMGTYTTVESDRSHKAYGEARMSDERVVGGESRTSIWQNRTVEVTIESAPVSALPPSHAR